MATTCVAPAASTTSTTPRPSRTAVLQLPVPALREAVQDGKTTALITPDRTLGRRVAAALSRWGIVADDSSGRPLSQTAPGRFLRQTARLIGAEARSEDLIALLKHPLAVAVGDHSSDSEFPAPIECLLAYLGRGLRGDPFDSVRELAVWCENDPEGKESELDLESPYLPPAG